MRQRIRKLVLGILGAIIFAAALWVLLGELHKYPPEAILSSIAQIPRADVAIALLFAAANYLVLIQFDALAFRSIGEHLPYRRVMLAAFVGYVLSNNAGFNTLSGSSVRYRFYSGWGVPGWEILRVVIFYSLTFYVGLFWLGGVIFLFQPMDIPGSLDLPFATVRPLGAILLALGIVYLALCTAAKRSLHLWRFEVVLPSLRLAVFQIVLAALDWMFVCAVLFVLLPSHGRPLYPALLGVFMLAQIAGLISQVPGGLGIFETVVVFLLHDALPTPQIMGSLLAYRAIYYLLPLVIALALMAGHEIAERRRRRA